MTFPCFSRVVERWITLAEKQEERSVLCREEEETRGGVRYPSPELRARFGPVVLYLSHRYRVFCLDGSLTALYRLHAAGP